MSGALLRFSRSASALAAYPLLLAVWGLQFAAVSYRLLPWPGGAAAGAFGMAGAPRGCPNCDFTEFWAAAVLAAHGHAATAYDLPSFQDFQRQVFFPGIVGARWYYPPPAFLAFWPVANLPFGPAFYAWTGATLAISCLLLAAARLPWKVVGLAALSPAAGWDLVLGQFGILMGAILVFGLLTAETAPLAAGAVLGLLVIKPQAGVLAAVALLAARNTRAILAAAGCAAILLAVSTLWLGWPIWHAYLTHGLALSKLVLQAPVSGADFRTGITLFWMCRSFGAGLAISYGAQAAAALVAAVLTWRLWRPESPHRFDRLDRGAITVLLCVVATPFGYTGDMVAWSAALAALAARRGWRIDLLDALFWVWPALCPVVYLRTGLLVTPVLAALAAGRAWRRGARAALGPP